MKRMQLSFPTIASLLFAFTLTPLSMCHAQESPSVELHASISPDKGATGQLMQFKIELRSAGDSSIPEPTIPTAIPGFQILGRSVSKQVAIGPQGKQVTASYLLTLLPLKVGHFTLPAISLKYRGKSYQTEAISLEVIQGDGEDPGFDDTAPQQNIQPDAPPRNSIKGEVII